MQPPPTIHIQEEHCRTIGEEHHGDPEREADKGHEPGAAIIPAARDDVRRDRDQQFENAAAEHQPALAGNHVRGIGGTAGAIE